MHEMINEIFRDAGATEEDLKMIEELCLLTAMEVRQHVLNRASAVPPTFQLPMRVLLARIVHADMEKAFMQYRTAEGTYDLDRAGPLGTRH